MKQMIKTKFKALIVDALSWTYLGFLLWEGQTTWAAVWAGSIGILNFVYIKYPYHPAVRFIRR